MALINTDTLLGLANCMAEDIVNRINLALISFPDGMEYNTFSFRDKEDNNIYTFMYGKDAYFTFEDGNVDIYLNDITAQDILGHFNIYEIIHMYNNMCKVIYFDYEYKTIKEMPLEIH
jgi:hypothetical protein